MEKNTSKQVTLNIADTMAVGFGNPLFGGHEHPVCGFLCEVIVDGAMQGTFDASIALNASLNAIVAEKYGEDEFEAEGKSAFDFDNRYIKDAVYDYIESTGNGDDLIDSYGEEIMKQFNEKFSGELTAAKVTCKPVKEFGFQFYGRY